MKAELAYLRQTDASRFYLWRKKPSGTNGSRQFEDRLSLGHFCENGDGVRIIVVFPADNRQFRCQHRRPLADSQNILTVMSSAHA